MWAAFFALVTLFLALDLGVFHRRPHAIGLREAALWSVVWVLVSLAFNAGVWRMFGPAAGLEFLTGYLIEKALSVDNLFVFVVLFSSFAVPPSYQHRVLFWGIVGAIVMRGIFVAIGAAALERFHGTIYVFAALLAWTGVRLLVQREHEPDPARHPLFRWFRRVVPSTDGYRDSKFFVRENGKRLATPLFFVLVAIEVTDLLFAVDSIPAIFAITRDPFLVLTSNVFALFGLRAMYFLLAGALAKLALLKAGLALVLVFVAAKMALSDFVTIPIGLSLGVTAALIGGAVLASLVTAARRRAPLPRPDGRG